MKIEKLKPYKNNPRNNDTAVNAVAASIKEFGFKVPIIIDKNSEIVAGHTRDKAAKQLGLTEVPCIIADDLTPEQVKAFRLADNKTGELAGWNIDLLNIEMKDIEIDMGQFGFELSDTPPETYEDEYDADEILGNDQPAIRKPGEIWQLGRHRLFCGDNTDIEGITKLMKGATASL
jgi:site-specific DNA-methyltransferase (adenine-specific)